VAEGKSAMQRGIEGLWTFEALSADGWPVGGAVVLIGGRLLGGGNRYYYVGSYRERDHGRVFEGEARLFHFHGPTVDAFGSTSPDFRVPFRGHRLSDLIEGEAYRPESPQLRRAFRLCWRAGTT
jgi:hypothetical protein